MNQRTGHAAHRRKLYVLVSLAILGAVPTRAVAGGFEAPGLGVEAMGRGGAFAAKADDGTALEYNIAGFARQRGTHVLVEGKLVLNDSSFSRAGVYPGVAGSTPYAGQPYPTVSNTTGVSGTPLVAISTDFGYFDRWTFAVGLTTPSASDADRTYPTTVNGNWPAPQRYDLYNANLLVVYPMLAAAVRATKWLDIGLALQMVYGKFDLSSAASADLGTICPNQESTQCDVTQRVQSSGFTATGVLGIMVHPVEGLHLAVNLRGPIVLNSSGTVTATSPPALPLPLDPAPATLPFHLPWVLRFGARYAFMKGTFERGDIEIDGTYETWHQSQGTGDTLSIPTLGPFTDIKATLNHHYKDTGSVRIGGAWNFLFSNASVLSVRAGWFYDSAATSPQWTRNDFDTLDKIGIAFGLGYHIRGVTINAAYTYITSPTRIILDGHQQALNGINGSNSYANGDPFPVVNNGTYSSSTQLIMLGLNFHVDEIMRKKRVLKYD